MKTKGESIKVVIGAVLSMIISLCPVWGERVVYADPAIPEATEENTYNSSHNWSGTLEISEEKTIKQIKQDHRLWQGI